MTAEKFTETIINAGELLSELESKEMLLKEVFNWNKIKGKLQARLINAEANKERLENVPHRLFLDLAVVYYLKVSESEDYYGMIEVTNHHANVWEQDEAALFKTALENLKSNQDVSFQELRAVIQELGVQMDDIPDEPKVYVLSNKKRISGSIAMVNNDFLKVISVLIGGDFIILPSSIHELLILKEPEACDFSMYSSMVHDANRFCVRPEEVLSDHVYLYDCHEEKVKIVA